MNQLEGKNVLVTGASSGIGEEMAKQFVRLGANVILVSRSAKELERVSDELKQFGSGKVKVLPMDLSVPGSAKKLFEKTESLGLTVDYLVNNAGFGAFGAFEENDPQKYSSLLQLNIVTLTELCHLYLPQMKKRNEGGILNVASTAAYLPVPYAAVYSASKSFVLYFTEALSGEVLGTNVKITCLSPSRTRTKFAERADGDPSNYDTKPTDTAENSAKVGIEALLKGESSVISGPQKFMVSILPRFFSRSRVVKLASKEYKK